MIGKYVEEGWNHLVSRGLQTVRGCETGNSVRQSRAYIDSIQVELRVIDAPLTADTSCTMFGRTFATPLMSGAMSGVDNIREHGMIVFARGMQAAGSCMWVGIGPDQEMQEICDLGIPTVKIIKPYRDTDKIFQKLEAAEKAGCIAVGMDIDFAFGSKSGDFLKANDWCSPKTSGELASFIKATKLPFIFKGVLSERDAYKAMELGAGGIVISSHSGNAIDYAVPPMKILPKIAKIVDRKVPLLIDGDIKHGSDVFKALALGADGALAGRSLMAGMELDGAEGITKVVNGITEELRRNMCLTGAASIGEIDPSVLWLP